MEGDELLELSTEVGSEIDDSLVLDERAGELLPLYDVLLGRKDLVHESCYFFLVDGAASMRGHLLVLENCKVA